MAKNEFLPFAVEAGALVQPLQEYSTDNRRKQGNQPGIADPEFCNRTWRQSAIMAAALGMLIEEQGGDALDDGNVAKLKNAFKAAVGKLQQSGLSDSVTSASSTVGASSKAVKTAYDKAVDAKAQSNTVRGNYTGNGGQIKPKDLGTYTVQWNMCNTPLSGDTGYKDIMFMNTYSDSDVKYRSMIAVKKSSGPTRGWIGTEGTNAEDWTNHAELITELHKGVSGGFVPLDAALKVIAKYLPISGSLESTDASLIPNMPLFNQLLKLIRSEVARVILSETPKAGAVPIAKTLRSGLTGLDGAWRREPGELVTYAGTAIPHHCLPCNGAAYSRTDYAGLFAALGTTWGGSGATFNVPDLRGLYLRVSGNGFALGQKLEDTLRRHQHHVRTSTRPAVEGTPKLSIHAPRGIDGYQHNYLTDVQNDYPAGYPWAEETRPKSAVINIAIAY